MKSLPEAIVGGRSTSELAVAMGVLLDKLEVEFSQWCAVVEMKILP